MADYRLYYWPIPFRGQFIRALLAHVGASWEEAGAQETARLKDTGPGGQPVPAMAPPMLTDHEAGVTLAQMPAIMVYLARKHGLMPPDPAREALALKVVSDANDILDEITRWGGRIAMWDRESWAQFRPRLRRWMAIFEETGRRNGLSASGGTMLGTDAPGLADLVTAVLWFTMIDKLPALRPVLTAEAPAVAALADRLMHSETLAAMRSQTDADFGPVYCGGQIEASLRAVLD